MEYENGNFSFDEPISINNEILKSNIKYKNEIFVIRGQKFLATKKSNRNILYFCITLDTTNDEHKKFIDMCNELMVEVNDFCLFNFNHTKPYIPINFPGLIKNRSSNNIYTLYIQQKTNTKITGDIKFYNNIISFYIEPIITLDIIFTIFNSIRVNLLSIDISKSL